MINQNSNLAAAIFKKNKHFNLRFNYRTYKKNIFSIDF